MHRFLVPPERLQGEEVCLEGPVARQMARVLRLQPGDEVALLDGQGREFRARLVSLTRREVRARILGVEKAPGEPSVHLTLYQGLLKGEKWEWVLQKGTEVGVSAFVPLRCRRSIPRPVEGWAETKYPRWERVLQEAAEQSGRSRVPTLSRPLPLAQACREAQGWALLLWEGERALGLREALSRLRERHPAPPWPPVHLFIGPEGGFDPEEVEVARSCGLLTVGLGRRVLRSETAAVVASALVLYELGALAP